MTHIPLKSCMGQSLLVINTSAGEAAVEGSLGLLSSLYSQSVSTSFKERSRHKNKVKKY